VDNGDGTRRKKKILVSWKKENDEGKGGFFRSVGIREG